MTCTCVAATDWYGEKTDKFSCKKMLLQVEKMVVEVVDRSVGKDTVSKHTESPDMNRREEREEDDVTTNVHPPPCTAFTKTTSAKRPLQSTVYVRHQRYTLTVGKPMSL